jgi:ATP:guanido phosphotransferase, C-terminal catalytic domain/ATP:guanido phosphotransferase, N-terminal domain
MESCLQRGDVSGCSDLIRALPAAFVGPSITPDAFSNRSNLGVIGVPNQESLYDDDFPEFTRLHRSAVARILTRDMYKDLCRKSRAAGYPIDLATRPAVECPETSTGILLGSENSYEQYSRLIVPVIKDIHGGFDCTTTVHTPMDPQFRNLIEYLDRMDPMDTSYVNSMFIIGSRNLYGFPLLPACDRKTRRAVEYVLRTAFQRRSRELGGKYYSMIDLTPEEAEALDRDPQGLTPIEAFDNTPQNLIEPNFDYPDGRGLYQNRDRQVFAWVNDEDHLKLICRATGKNIDMAGMIREWARTLVTVETCVEPSGFCYMHSERLGYITSCPSNLGTAMRLAVIMRLPALNLRQDTAEALGRTLNLHFKPAHMSTITGCNASRAVDNTLWEVSNSIVLGYTEVDIIQNFFFSINSLSEQERHAAGKKTEPPAKSSSSILRPILQAVRAPDPPQPQPQAQPQPQLRSVRAPDYVPSDVGSISPLPPPPIPIEVVPPAPTSVSDPWELTPDELKYIQDNSFLGPGENKKVTCTRMPEDSMSKYAGRLGIRSLMALEGSSMLKKMGGPGGDLVTVKRFVWIDHLTKTIHWSHSESKGASHSAFRLDEVSRIVRPPGKVNAV